MHLQLTISLLVSRHIPAITRCLDSLVPILMQVPSELIVVDTSQNDQVRDLALQYTDQVIPFCWCDDFSKARNVGLQAARGEWFMYIDDDEWLEDADEIIRFFSSGEYRHYNSAAYIQRNYFDWTGGEHLDAYVGRMIRRRPGARFVNTIHEYITPYLSPVKNFSAYVHHYGYMGRFIDSKTDRNIPLLEKELEADGSMVHNYAQLCQEHMSAGQYAEAEADAVKCLGLEEGDKKEEEKSWCLAYLPYLIYWQKDYERALDVGKKMLRHPFCTEIAALLIYTAMVSACEALKGKEKDILVYAKSYHQGLSRLDSRPEQWFLQSIGGLGEQQVKNLKNKMCMSGFLASVRLKDLSSAKTFLQWFPWESKEIENIYPFFHALFQKKENNTFLFDLFSGVEKDDPFVFIIKAEAAWKEGDIGLAQKYSGEAALEGSVFVQQEALYLALCSFGEISLDPWMYRADIQQWTIIAKNVAGRVEANGLTAWIESVEKYLPRFPIQSLAVLSVLQEKYLIEGVLEIGDDRLLQELEKYCEWVRQYALLVYNAELTTGQNICLLPQNCCFALQMGHVFQCLKKNDRSGVLGGIRQAAHTYAPFCGILRRILSIIEKVMESVSGHDGEFDLLAVQVKKMIRDLIRDQRYQEALPLVQQLSSLLPGDLEVLRLRQGLWGHIGEQKL